MLIEGKTPIKEALSNFEGLKYLEKLKKASQLLKQGQNYAQLYQKKLIGEKMFNDISDTLKDLELIDDHFEALKYLRIDKKSHETISQWRSSVQDSCSETLKEKLHLLDQLILVEKPLFDEIVKS